ncbi:MAG: hypothetical protein ACRD8U_00050 [Pyrinomonadaceae bacterium]
MSISAIHHYPPNVVILAKSFGAAILMATPRQATWFNGQICICVTVAVPLDRNHGRTTDA